MSTTWILRENACTRELSDSMGGDLVTWRLFNADIGFVVDLARQADGLIDGYPNEGAAFIDLDVHRVVFFGGPYDITDAPWRRRALLPLMQALLAARYPTGPRWTLTWGHECMASLEQAAGLPVSWGDDRGSCRSLAELAADPATGPLVLTVRDGSGAIRDVGFSTRPPWEPGIAEVLGYGEPCLPMLESRASLDQLPHESKVSGGAFLDLQRRSISAWHHRARSDVRPRIARAWPGVRLEVHDGGFPRQVDESGRDGSALAVSPAQAIEEAVDSLGVSMFSRRDIDRFYTRFATTLWVAGWADEQPFVAGHEPQLPAGRSWRDYALDLAGRVVAGKSPRWTHGTLMTEEDVGKELRRAD